MYVVIEEEKETSIFFPAAPAYKHIERKVRKIKNTRQTLKKKKTRKIEKFLRVYPK